MYSPTAPDAPLRGATRATPWTMRSAEAGSRKLIGIGVAVTAAYIVAAKLGFRVAFVAEQVTTVWPPTGLAEAALLLWGRSLWPAIWLGAFITNAGTNMPLWGAASIATGNTIEAVVAAAVLLRVKNFGSRRSVPPPARSAWRRTPCLRPAGALGASRVVFLSPFFVSSILRFFDVDRRYGSARQRKRLDAGSPSLW
jgi:hypothetical protein